MFDEKKTVQEYVVSCSELIGRWEVAVYEGGKGKG